MTIVIPVPIPAETLEAIAIRAAEIVLERMTPDSPWLDRKQAAAYLAVPVSRLEKDKRIPCHRDNGRVLYHRAELDDYFRSLDSPGH